MPRFRLDRLPFMILWFFVAAAAIGMPVAYALGLLPKESSGGRIILLWYFGILTAVLGCAFSISGNTIHHHYRTGTVQRGTSPRMFRWITTAYFFIAALLMTLAALFSLHLL